MRTIFAMLLVIVVAPPFAGAPAPAAIPQITALSVDRDRLEGGAEVVVDGTNFTPDTDLFLGDAAVESVTVESPTRLRFQVPPQRLAGGRTLTVRTEAGTAQTVFHVLGKRLDEIADGEITSVAGGIPYAGDGALATSPTVGLRPSGIAVDGDGNIFVSDMANNRIRRIDAVTGVITTVAGTGEAGYSGDGGPALAASFRQPRGLAFDGDGNLFVADSANYVIRKIDAATGNISTAAERYQDAPFDVAVAPSGDIYVGEYTISSDYLLGVLVRHDAMTGEVEAVALQSDPNAYVGKVGLGLDASGDVLVAAYTEEFGPFVGRIDSSTGAVTRFDISLLDEPIDVLSTPDGDLLLVGEFSRIYRFDPGTGAVTPIAGDAENGFEGDGGPAVEARLHSPQAIALDAAGNLLIADAGNLRVRKVDASGTITTSAGSGAETTFVNGWPATSVVVSASQVAVAGNGVVYAVGGNRIYIAYPDTELFSSFTFLTPGSESPPAAAGLAVADAHNVYVSDAQNGTILRIDTLAGIVERVEVDSGAPISHPSALALDGKGRLYALDSGTTVNRIDLRNGSSKTIGSFDTNGFSWGDEYMTVDRRGKTVYLSQFDKIRRLSTATRTVKVVAGLENLPGTAGDGGKAKLARVASLGVALDRRGNLFLANRYAFVPPSDDFSASIRRIDARDKRIERVAGTINSSGSYGGDGGPALGAGFIPSGLAFDATGNLYVADGNGRIRVIRGIGQ